MTVILGEELITALSQIRDILNKESPVRQQQLIETLVASHVYAMGKDEIRLQEFVLDSMLKHIRQIIKSWREQLDVRH